MPDEGRPGNRWFEFLSSSHPALASQVRVEGTEVLVLEVVEPFVYSTPPQMARGYAPEMQERLREQLRQAELSAEHAAETLRAGGFKATTRVVEAEIRTGSWTSPPIRKPI